MSNTAETGVSTPVPPKRMDWGFPVSWDDIDPSFWWLAKRAYGWQFGEQGFLQTVLTCLGIEVGTVFEAGAGDGAKLPLACEGLIREGWKSILVEPDTGKLETLKSRLESIRATDSHCFHDVIATSARKLDGAATVDEIFARVGVVPDVMILDIDSCEFYVLAEMVARPKVILVEHHDLADGEHDGTVPLVDECGKDNGRGFFVQVPWAQTKAMLAKHGYTCVAKTRVNGLYVRDDLAPLVAAGPKKRRWAKKENPKVVLVLSQPRLTFTAQALAVQRLCAETGYATETWGGAFWDRDITIATKNSIAKYEPDFLLYIDYDTVFEPKDVQTLLDAINNDPEMGAIGSVQMSRHNDLPLVFDERQDYTTELTQVDYSHFGLTLVRREVFEELPEPWFWSMPNDDGSWTATDRSDADITFWRMLHEKQIKVCQHNKVVLGHIIQGIKYPCTKGKGFVIQPVEHYIMKGKPDIVGFNPDLYKARA